MSYLTTQCQMISLGFRKVLSANAVLIPADLPIAHK